jgi:hypothetical protein
MNEPLSVICIRKIEEVDPVVLVYGLRIEFSNGFSIHHATWEQMQSFKVGQTYDITLTESEATDR